MKLRVDLLVGGIAVRGDVWVETEESGKPLEWARPIPWGEPETPIRHIDTVEGFTLSEWRAFLEGLWTRANLPVPPFDGWAAFAQGLPGWIAEHPGLDPKSELPPFSETSSSNELPPEAYGPFYEDRGQHQVWKNMMREALGRWRDGLVDAGSYDLTAYGLPAATMPGSGSIKLPTRCGPLFPLEPDFAAACRRLGFKRLAESAWPRMTEGDRCVFFEMAENTAPLSDERHPGPYDRPDLASAPSLLPWGARHESQMAPSTLPYRPKEPAKP